MKEKIKDWWNDFKQDLFFNITMTIMCSFLFMMFVFLAIICFKVMIETINLM